MPTLNPGNSPDRERRNTVSELAPETPQRSASTTELSSRHPLGSYERIRLYGIPIRDDDLRRLVVRLVRFGYAKDVDLAARIGWGITSETALLALSTQERDAILRVLDNPPAGLVELRGALARDQRDRYR